MSPGQTRDGSVPSSDIRLRGFANRASVEEAMRWIDAQAGALPGRECDAARAGGCLLAAAVEAPHAIPPADRVAENGYALHAGETAGAGSYNPLSFRLASPDKPLPSGAAALVVSGAALPPGSDAVLPFDVSEPDGTIVEVVGEVAGGTGVQRRGQQAAAGSVLIERGRGLRPQDLGLLASLGLSRVLVAPRPRVKLIIAGPKSPADGASHDANGPMLRALVARDGGIVSHVVSDAATHAAMIEAMADNATDVVFVVGRTGTGADDIAPLALAEAGELSVHGIALRPGGSAGLGRLADVPVVLLPGDPLACLGAYEMLAGRLIRRLGGRDPDLPHPRREMEVVRKIVSAVGLVDLCQVRVIGDRADVVGSAGSGGLGSAVAADGFVVVPAPLEGYAPGARVDVRLYATRS